MFWAISTTSRPSIKRPQRTSLWSSGSAANATWIAISASWRWAEASGRWLS